MPPEVRAGQHRWVPAAQALGAGVLQALCFAPGPLPSWTLPFAQILTLAVLFGLCMGRRRVAHAAGLGALFGLGLFATGVHWLVISMHRYGGLALPLAVAALLLFAIVLAAFVAAACALATWLRHGHQGAAPNARTLMATAATWACAWTAFEWLRGTLFTGFTWLDAGYAHVEGMLTAWAPILGVYGVGWLAAFAAAAVAIMVRARNTPAGRSAAAVLALAIVSGLAGIALNHLHWARAHGEPLMVRLVQPNTSLSLKFDPERLVQGQQFAQHLAALAPKTDESQPALVILPETVVPVFQDQLPAALWQGWRDVATTRDATVLMGVPLHTRDGERARYTNSAIALRPEGAAAAQTPPWHYDKHHLVPFGEFIPPGFHWFVRALSIPLGDFDRGAAVQPPLVVNGQALAVDICFEDAFGEEIAAHVAGHGEISGANILVNLSNLAWFGHGWALRQHLQIARMRAIETARPMLQVSNTGVTAAIDAQGRVIDQLDVARPGLLDAPVQGAQGLTPYVRWRNAPILLLSLLGLLAFGLVRRRRRP